MPKCRLYKATIIIIIITIIIISIVFVFVISIVLMITDSIYLTLDADKHVLFIPGTDYQSQDYAISHAGVP